MGCLPFFHKWPPAPKIEVVDVDPATAAIFGNVVVSYRCTKCGKVRSYARFRP